jgi:hypothetical protein
LCSDLSESFLFANTLPRIAAGFLTVNPESFRGKSRKGAKPQRVFSALASLQCYPSKLRIFDKFFSALCFLLRFLSLLLFKSFGCGFAALRLGVFALKGLFYPRNPWFNSFGPSSPR